MSEYGTLTMRVYPTCPECGGPWDAPHSEPGGPCPGRPDGCTCRCDMQYHRPPTGLHKPSHYAPYCACRYVPGVKS